MCSESDHREMPVAWMGDPKSEAGQQALKSLAAVPDAAASAEAAARLIQAFSDEMARRYSSIAAGEAKAADFPLRILIADISPAHPIDLLPSSELERLARLSRGANMGVRLTVQRS